MHLDKDDCPFFSPCSRTKTRRRCFVSLVHKSLFMLLWCQLALLLQEFSCSATKTESVVFKAKAAAEEVPTHYLYLHSILSGNVF